MQPTLLFAGKLRREYLLPLQGRPLVDVPGGNVLYAAVGARLWTGRVGLIARVGEDFPYDWLHSLDDHGMDTEGIQLVPEPIDIRSFIAYVDTLTPQRTNPVSHFARLKLPFPKTLLGYQAPGESQDNRVKAAIDSPRFSDVPRDYLDAKAVHLCPLDYLTHTQLVPALRRVNRMTVTIDPGPGYMTSGFLDDMRTLLQGVTVFMPSEEEIRALFWGKTNDLWDMAERLTDSGCEIVVIKRGSLGQLLYDGTIRRRWEIPAYPARVADPTGAGDAFCGGFLAGYIGTYDPVQAALQGNVSASLVVEGSGAFFAFEALPGLAEARLHSLAEIARQL
jgi:sugar/nucleoside kinase (ribokinase family)